MRTEPAGCDDASMSSNVKPTSTASARRVTPITVMVVIASAVSGYGLGYGLRRLQDGGATPSTVAIITASMLVFLAVIARKYLAPTRQADAE